MLTPREQYAKALDEIADRNGKLDHQTVRRLIELLQETRTSIRGALLGDVSDFETFRLTQLQKSIDLIVGQFQDGLSLGLGESFQSAHSLGVASVIEPLQAAGVGGVFNVISPTQANVVLDFSAQLVQDISDDLRRSINGQIRLSVLAQQTPFQAMKNITNALGVKAKDGVWGTHNRPEVVRGVAARAEAIVRTEMTRVFNLATHSQQKATSEARPELGLLKTWIATGGRRTRDSHLRAHNRYRRKPIPIKEKFEVGNSKLMFPGDPRGAARETVNCRCTTTTIYPDVDRLATPLDSQIDNEIEKREKKVLNALPDNVTAAPDAKNYTPQYQQRLTEHVANKAYYDDYLRDESPEEYRQAIGESEDLIRLEEDISNVARSFDYTPANMTQKAWRLLADDLEKETGRLLKFSTEARRVGAGEKARGPATDIIQLGGKDALAKGGAVTAKDAKRLAADLNRETKERATDYMIAQLSRMGYSKKTIDSLSDSPPARLEQVRRLMAEIGHGVPQKAKIGKIPIKERLAVINSTSDSQRLKATAAARQPRTVEGLDMWDLYQEASLRGGIDEPDYIPDELWGGDESESIPRYILRPGG